MGEMQLVENKLTDLLWDNNSGVVQDEKNFVHYRKVVPEGFVNLGRMETCFPPRIASITDK